MTPRLDIRLFNFINMPQNKILIVGDRPGPSAPIDPNYHHTPFYSMKHCSGWLNKLLDGSGIDENKLLWINTYDKDGIPNKISPHSLKPSKIIALGGNASKWVKSFKVSFTSTYHPQYWKRFRNKEIYPLLNILND